LNQVSRTVTVFTATYNRAHTLHRVYESLTAQTYKGFEWLIIDDGSTDGTRELVAAWQQEADFTIQYVWKENEGKHIAINMAVRMVKTEYIVMLDSDDACVPNALERFEYHWNSIPESERSGYLSIEVLCQYENGELVGDRFPDELEDSNLNEMRFRYRVRGEKWGSLRVVAIREAPFPESIKNTYVPEGIVWMRLSRLFKTRFVNEALRIYYVDQPSISRGSDRFRWDATGYLMHHGAVLNDLVGYFNTAPWLLFRSAINCSRYSFRQRISLAQQIRNLHNGLARALWAAGLPAGYLLYLRDRLSK